MRSLSALTFFVVLATISPAQALFTTFGPGESYQQNVGRSFSGVDNSFNHFHSDLGWQFSPTSSDFVRTISIAARYYEGTNSATIRLFTNAAQNQLGTEINSWQLTDMPLVNAIAPPQTINVSSSNVFLSSAEKYWLVLSPTDSTLYAAWMDNNQGITGRMAWSLGVNNFTYVDNMPLSAFAINAVPEPATFAVIASIATLAARKRRKG